MSEELWVGGTGLIGKKVAEYARSEGVEVAVTAKSESEDPTGNAEILDITDFESVKEYFWKHNFKKAIIAAGVALPSAAEKNPELAYLVNAEGPKNIGRAILTLPEGRRPSVVFMGSALQYDIKKEGPVSENTPFVTEGGAYVMSKIKMVEFVQDLVAKGLDAKIAMIFNTTGPGQSTDYFLPSMADQAAQISLGLKEPVIKSGFVGHIRDFSHVDDTAKGIFLALKGKSGDLINISSGYGVRLQEVVDQMIKLAGVKNISHVVDSSLNQPPKIQAFWGDNSRLRSLGFVSSKTLKDICVDLFEERILINQDKIEK